MPPAGRAEGLRATRPSRFAGGRHHFHVSAFGVANSAAKVELTGFAMHKPAEACTLHAALNEEVKNQD
jgi:hypothetical protein